MAIKLTKMPPQPDYTLRLTIGGKEYSGVGYESAYFAEGVYEFGNSQYYARHADDDMCAIASVKRDKGLTVNFWGTVCLSEPIDFGDCDEMEVEVCEMEEI